jgi:hypothetical protein
MGVIDCFARVDGRCSAIKIKIWSFIPLYYRLLVRWLFLLMEMSEVIYLGEHNFTLKR